MELLAPNSSFSTSIPALQIAWDSTSLGALKECPRKYYYTIVCGWTSLFQNVHLTFGIHMHTAKETFDRARAGGASHDEAVCAAVRRILIDTWDSKLNRPWTSNDKNKNRETLLRTIVWYFEDYKNDSIETLILANGKPAVELSFSFETTYRSIDANRPYLLCGHMDRLGSLGGKNYVCDVKTSKHTVDDKFFAGFSPDNQFSLYSFAAKVGFAIPVEGVIVDGIQVAITFSRTARAPSPRSEGQLAEWYEGLEYWLKQAEMYAAAGQWPQNEKSCGNYGGCQFRRVCSHSPSVRDQWLKADFVKRVWDPLQARGDI